MTSGPGRPLISVLFPDQPTSGGDIVAFGKIVRDSGATRLWLGQALRIESHPALAYLAGAGCRIPVGIGVSLMVLRHPYDAAVQARSLAALMEHPVTVGYGAADPRFVRSLIGAPYARPASAVEEYVTIMRALLRGEHVTRRGGLFEVDQELPPLTHPPVEVGAGVLRPTMARAAGRSADAAMTWLCPPNYLSRTILPALRAGAQDRNAVPRVVAVVPVAVDRPGRSAFLLAQHGAFNHLRTAHYTDMLRRAGLDLDASDPVSGARELVEEGVYVYGKPGDIADGVRRYHEAGVGEVVLNLVAVANLHGQAEAIRDLSQILAELS